MTENNKRENIREELSRTAEAIDDVDQEQPVVEPQVSHFRQVPFLTRVK